MTHVPSRRAVGAENPLIGRRIRLLDCTDPHCSIKPGSEGTVKFVDDLGTVHTAWDDGRVLGLVEQAGDRWEVLP